MLRDIVYKKDIKINLLFLPKILYKYTVKLYNRK